MAIQSSTPTGVACLCSSSISGHSEFAHSKKQQAEGHRDAQVPASGCIAAAFPVCIVTDAAGITHLDGLWVNARGS